MGICVGSGNAFWINETCGQTIERGWLKKWKAWMLLLLCHVSAAIVQQDPFVFQRPAIAIF
jgi:hypothetical protein